MTTAPLDLPAVGTALGWCRLVSAGAWPSVWALTDPTYRAVLVSDLVGGADLTEAASQDVLAIDCPPVIVQAAIQAALLEAAVGGLGAPATWTAAHLGPAVLDVRFFEHVLVSSAAGDRGVLVLLSLHAPSAWLVRLASPVDPRQ